MTVRELWNACEPLSAEEVEFLTGHKPKTKLEDKYTEFRYAVDQSNDAIYAFLENTCKPRYVYRVYEFKDGLYKPVEFDTFTLFSIP